MTTTETRLAEVMHEAVPYLRPDPTLAQRSIAAARTTRRRRAMLAGVALAVAAVAVVSASIPRTAGQGPVGPGPAPDWAECAAALPDTNTALPGGGPPGFGGEVPANPTAIAYCGEPVQVGDEVQMTVSVSTGELPVALAAEMSALAQNGVHPTPHCDGGSTRRIVLRYADGSTVPLILDRNDCWIGVLQGDTLFAQVGGGELQRLLSRVDAEGEQYVYRGPADGASAPSVAPPPSG